MPNGCSGGFSRYHRGIGKRLFVYLILYIRPEVDSRLLISSRNGRKPITVRLTEVGLQQPVELTATEYSVLYHLAPGQPDC